MDYDKTAIAATYDAARSYRSEVLQRWLDLVASFAPPKVELVLDIGCGTGRFTQPLADRFGTRVIGIDPSESMLEAARGKSTNDHVDFRQASAEHLPLEDGCADLVFMSMMLHHLTHKERAARECRRVLSRGGRLCVRNSTRDSIYPQQRFFPGIQAYIRELPSRDEVMELFEAAGLQLCAYNLVLHPVAESWQELADKLALRADSFIARLPQAEFAQGLAGLRAHAIKHPGKQDVIDHIHFFVFGH